MRKPAGRTEGIKTGARDKKILKETLSKIDLIK